MIAVSSPFKIANPSPPEISGGIDLEMNVSASPLSKPMEVFPIFQREGKEFLLFDPANFTGFTFEILGIIKIEDRLQEFIASLR